MYKHILIATDGSELASKAVEHGLRLAKTVGAKATVVTVTEPWSSVAYGELGMAFPVDEYEKSCAARAQEVFAGVAKIADAVGVKCETHHVPEQFAAEGIIDCAKKTGCDLIVMASHGRRGLTRMLLGSQANNVLTHSAVPVLIWR